jgi:hydroxyacylglutathione hydrolase
MSNFSKTDFGPVKVISGENRSRFPYSNTIFIDDDVKAVIDTGAGHGALKELRQNNKIDLVINTHYHFDHIAYNYLFEDSKILVNDREADCYRDRRFIGQYLGMAEFYGEQWVDDWIGRIADPETEQSPYSPQNNHKWYLATARIDEEYSWNDVLDFGKTKMQVIGAPGHSEGFCCMFFPDYGIAYVGDIDLTSFGPWYGGTDGDIDLFINSCREIEKLDARIFITGHEMGILEKDDFKAGLDTFVKVIDKRESQILSQLIEPKTLRELGDMGLIYGKKFHVDAWVAMWNYLMTKKHVDRLVRNGELLQVADKFVRNHRKR